MITDTQNSKGSEMKERVGVLGTGFVGSATTGDPDETVTLAERLSDRY